MNLRHMKCIPGDYLMKLVERMPSVHVCKVVIKAKGGYFEESQIYFDSTPFVVELLHIS
jgi:hypothetical protein